MNGLPCSHFYETPNVQHHYVLNQVLLKSNTQMWKVWTKIHLCIKLTLILLMWRIWGASKNASRWQMGFNLAFKGLSMAFTVPIFMQLTVTQYMFVAIFHE